MEKLQEFLANAEIAYRNNKFSEALNWYREYLQQRPDDVEILAKAGSASILNDDYTAAKELFKKALDLDSENGNRVFDYANACFFSGENNTAFDLYIEAERLGCNQDVIPRLYYYMALICEGNNNVEAALFYIDKCKESDKDLILTISPEFISEEMMVHIATQDYDGAASCAEKLIAIQPKSFDSYMMCVSLLMANRKFERAETVLKSAELYACDNDDKRTELRIQKAALYEAIGSTEKEKEKQEEQYYKAIDTLKKGVESEAIVTNRDASIQLYISKLYMKMQKFNDAIPVLLRLLRIPEIPQSEEDDLYDIAAEAERSMEADIYKIQNAIESGELAGDLHRFTDFDYDEEGIRVYQYNDDAFSCLDDNSKEEISVDENDAAEIENALLEEAWFDLLNCYIETNDYYSAWIISRRRVFENRHYEDFSLYIKVLCMRKLGANAKDVENLSEKLIARYREEMINEPENSLPIILRSRLYAEIGNSTKAREMASLLVGDERDNLLAYIVSCEQSER